MLPHGREQLHVAALDGPVERGPQGLHVGDAVRVVEVDAVLGEKRGQLAHQVVGHTGRVDDLGAGPRRFGRGTARVGHVGDPLRCVRRGERGIDLRLTLKQRSR